LAYYRVTTKEILKIFEVFLDFETRIAYIYTMIQIYYQDGSSQVVRPSVHFKPDAKAVKELVESIAGVFPIKYYVTDFNKR
jgi:hypothetical protein